ncbi:TetR/AcrR family transcriptional regulator [Rathayibacter toxicus]|uniref:TetR/AcrR family transcriptional regulator n=1 Tax=Rathayibacter toxicus TaxID=145458 RepID=UPI001C059ABA|nr:TetR/AcrR family transcriptional regulator [Rathayibacter toxicus]
MLTQQDRPLERYGRRERKRLATRRGIEVAVLLLASERGPERVTIEDVSRKADVSTRTFFNYFASKEDALVGGLPVLSDQTRAAFVAARGALLDDLQAVFLVALEESIEQDRELHVRRRVLFREHPHLVGLKIAGMREFELAVEDLVVERLEAGGTGGVDAEQLRSRARMLTLLGLAAVKHAWAGWVDHDGHEALTGHIARSFEELRAVLG